MIETRLRFRIECPESSVRIVNLRDADFADAAALSAYGDTASSVDTVSIHCSPEDVNFTSASLNRVLEAARDIGTLKVGIAFCPDSLGANSSSVTSIACIVTYLGGATTQFRVVNSIFGDTAYYDPSNLCKIQNGNFEQMPAQRTVLLGDSIRCEILNVPYEDSTHTTRQKVRYWNGNPALSSCILDIPEYGDTSGAPRIAYSDTITAASIVATIDGDSSIAASIFLQDPWRVEKNQGLQQGHPHYFQTWTPYDFSQDTSSYGVFLRTSEISGSPRYRLKAHKCIDAEGNPKSASLLNTNDFVFVRVETDSPGSARCDRLMESDSLIEFEVDFTGPDAILNLVYKHHLASGRLGARIFGNANQRHIGTDWDRAYHLVYEDLGEAWITKSADGTHWSMEKRISSGRMLAMNPCVGVWPGAYSNVRYHIYAAFVEDDTVKTVYLDEEGGIVTLTASALEMPGDSSVTPVISIGQPCTGRLYLYTFWNDSSGLRYSSCVFNPGDPNLHTPNRHVLCETGARVPSTIPGAIGPSVSDGLGKQYLAWIQSDSVHVTSFGYDDCADSIPATQWLDGWPKLCTKISSTMPLTSYPSVALTGSAVHSRVFIVHSELDSVPVPFPEGQTYLVGTQIVFIDVFAPDFSPGLTRFKHIAVLPDLPPPGDDGPPVNWPLPAAPVVGSIAFFENNTDSVWIVFRDRGYQNLTVVKVDEYADTATFDFDEGDAPTITSQSRLGAKRAAFVVTETPSWTRHIATSSANLNKASTHETRKTFEFSPANRKSARDRLFVSVRIETDAGQYTPSIESDGSGSQYFTLHRGWTYSGHEARLVAAVYNAAEAAEFHAVAVYGSRREPLSIIQNGEEHAEGSTLREYTANIGRESSLPEKITMWITSGGIVFANIREIVYSGMKKAKSNAHAALTRGSALMVLPHPMTHDGAIVNRGTESCELVVVDMLGRRLCGGTVGSGGALAMPPHMTTGLYFAVGRYPGGRIETRKFIHD